MGFNFNGIPSAEVTIDGEVTTVDPAEDGYITEITVTGENYTVPAGKKWVLIGWGAYYYGGSSSIELTIDGVSLDVAYASATTTGFVSGTGKIILQAGDQIDCTRGAWFTYKEVTV